MKPILLLLIATSCLVSPRTVTAQSPVLLQTFNGGGDVAALGNDRILIGAPGDDTTATNAGAAYLFHTNGTLLATFTSPNPHIIGFGSAITALGNDRVAIGSYNGPSVYLFTTNGALVKTITGQEQQMGSAVAAVGNDKLLIGDPWFKVNPDTWDIYGAAYLYSTNGSLLTTFTNPHPGYVTGLGFSLAAFGNNRVLIGASAEWPETGAVYLFHTNGTLLRSFFDPAPSIHHYFGRSIAAVGTDRVLVGSPSDGPDPGEVHLFNTNGTLLLTITNPTPAAADRFGWHIAVLGNDRIVIGAPDDDTTGPDSGSAYVFSLNGTLLATINNPAPADHSQFGWRLTALGNDGVIICNRYGPAYLFSIPASPDPPSLAIQRTTTNTVVVSWPASATGFELQQNTNGISSVNWSNVTAGIQNDGTNKTLVVSPTGGSRFYRLVSP